MKVEQIQSHERVILITGDREWDDLETVVAVFSTFAPNTVIVHGWADGLDTVGDVVAEEMGLRRIRCPSHWRHTLPDMSHYDKAGRKWLEVHGPCPEDCREVVGRPAGVLRNRWMFDTYSPTEVHGFHNNILISKGTKDMLKYAQKKSCPNWLHTSATQRIESPKLGIRRVKSIISVSALDEFFTFEKKPTT